MTVFRGQVIGLGIDIVSISRIRRFIDEYSDKFRDFGFTCSEQRYCDAQSNPPQHYAVRWAIKEAYIKAIGDHDANPDLVTIEVLRDPVPHLSLTGDSKQLLLNTTGKKYIEDVEIAISMAHEQKVDLAVGIVLVF